MLELRQTVGGDMRLGYGGDAFNTAVYAARLGLDVGFISSIGDDHYSNWLLEQWHKEGLDCEQVQIKKGRSPALYIIRNDQQGERFFHYWRDSSPFRALLENLNSDQVVQMLTRYDLVYFTGIGLALLAPPQRRMLLECLSTYRSDGGKVAFDPNFRPILWASKDAAVYWIDQAYACADIILPSVDDEMALRPALSQASAMARLHELGIDEVVVKAGEGGCTVSHLSEITEYPLLQPVQPVDTTAAGDSFNAAYLQRRLAGGSIPQAVDVAQALAAKVILVSGAIISREQMA